MADKKPKEPEEVIKARMRQYENPDYHGDYSKLNSLLSNLKRIAGADGLNEMDKQTLAKAVEIVDGLRPMVASYEELSIQVKRTIPSFHRSAAISKSLFESDRALLTMEAIVSGKPMPGPIKEEVVEDIPEQIQVSKPIEPSILERGNAGLNRPSAAEMLKLAQENIRQNQNQNQASLI